MATTRSERSFDGVGGIRIVYDVWTPNTEPLGVVILCHGFGEHARRYDHVAQRFGEGGLITYALDQRGHGRSGGKRVFLKNISEYTDDFHHLVGIATAAHPSSSAWSSATAWAAVSCSPTASSIPDDYAAMVLSGPAVYAQDGVSPR